jgi:hypothetical protein
MMTSWDRIDFSKMEVACWQRKGSYARREETLRSSSPSELMPHPTLVVTIDHGGHSAMASLYDRGHMPAGFAAQTESAPLETSHAAAGLYRTGVHRVRCAAIQRATSLGSTRIRPRALARITASEPSYTRLRTAVILMLRVSATSRRVNSRPGVTGIVDMFDFDSPSWLACVEPSLIEPAFVKTPLQRHSVASLRRLLMASVLSIRLDTRLDNGP